MTDRVKTHDGYLRVLNYLREAIREGAFAPGDRLPTERQLSEQFAVGRAITRRALGELEADGSIRRQVGRGTFVRPASDMPERTKSLSGEISPAEYIETRLCFEPELAWLVATHANSADFDRMEECLRRGKVAGAREEFELWDAAFHQAIATATHNKLTIQLYAMIHAVRHEQAMWGTLKQRGQTPVQRQVFQKEHRDILEALKRREAGEARELMSQHIRATRKRLLDY